MRFDDVLRLLPPAFQAALAGRPVAPVPGLGGASVFRVSDPAGGCRYLKLARGPDAAALRREIERTRWLSSHRVRVPAFLMTTCTDEVAAVLMTAVHWRHLDPERRPPASDLAAMVGAVGRGLARLHALPAADCPFDETPRVRLRRAEEAIARNLIDAGAFDDRNAGVTPAALCRRLAGAIPAGDDIVVVHGDAALENLLIGADGDLGFVDCGHAGRSDRYVDLALVEAALRTGFGNDAAEAFKAAYGIRDWDVRKAAFFSDLYELF